MVWAQVGKGRLSVRGRPGRAFWESLPKSGVTHLLTLLSEKEGAKSIGSQAEEAGLRWTWLPLPNGDIPQGKVLDQVRLIIPGVVIALQEGDAVVVHCAAGIHRTGMITYLVLRLAGLTSDQAREQLVKIRQVTGEGVGEERLSWVDTFIEEFRE
jgi:protein-tyrosine phosphatase